MDDYDQSQYQEVSSVSKRMTGSGTRIGKVIVYLIVGLLLLAGCFYLLTNFDNTSFKTAQSLSEAGKALIIVPSSPVYQKNNLRVVYISGLATTDETLTDPLLTVSGQALVLIRRVENFQWMETKTSPDNDKHNTYNYVTAWREGIIKSNSFKHPEGHENPSTSLFTSANFTAKKILVGEFTLPAQVYKLIPRLTYMDLSAVDVSNIQKTTQKPLFRSANEIFIGADPQHPQPGDVKITLMAVLPQVVSVIGQQSDDSIQAYAAHAGEPVLLLVGGKVPPRLMLKMALNDKMVHKIMLRLSMSATPKLVAGIGGVVVLIIIISILRIKNNKKKPSPLAIVDTEEPTFPIEDDEKYHAPLE